MLPLVSAGLPGPINNETYHIHLADKLATSFPKPSSLRRRPKDVELLRRYWGTVPKWWPVNNTTDCAWPLYLHYKMTIACGHHQIADELVQYLSSVKKLWKQWQREKIHSPSEANLYEDDFFRHYLKALSGYAYPLIYTNGPGYMLFTHLHALNAKAPYTHEQIVEDIDSWTSSHTDGKPKKINMAYYRRTLASTMTKWQTYPLDECLTFKQFANDPFRWGTSGGAPKVNIFGKEQRSKWAWALKHKVDPQRGYQEKEDLYEIATRNEGTAKVALKEEAQKTREIITTPITSYMRQTYLLYRRGKVPIPSPIAGPGWLPEFEGTNYAWYGCIDGERFDHVVPKEAVIELVRALGEVDDETRAVAQAEIEHLNSLEIEWSNMKWKFEGGVLSGWRFTSLLDSMVSLAAAEYIIDKTGTNGAIGAGVMGDDIVLFSHSTSLTAATMVELYNEFGLKANLHKTVSGPQGEFLRKVRSKGGSWAFPALDLKTITHAAPWIANTQFAMEEECATAWHTLLSRLLPHATDPDSLQDYIRKHTVTDLTNRFGRDKAWEDWLNTPMCAGGGGYVETAADAQWTMIIKERDQVVLTPYEKLGQLTGVLPTRRTLVKVSTEAIDVSRLIAMQPQLKVSTMGEYTPRFKRSANITKIMWALVSNTISATELNNSLVTHLPHRMRMLRGQRLATLLSTAKKSMDSIPSIVHTRESLPQAGQILSALSKQLAARKSGIPAKLIKPLVTVYALTRYRNVTLPYGTW